MGLNRPSYERIRLSKSAGIRWSNLRSLHRVFTLLGVSGDVPSPLKLMVRWPMAFSNCRKIHVVLLYLWYRGNAQPYCLAKEA